MQPYAHNKIYLENKKQPPARYHHNLFLLPILSYNKSRTIIKISFDWIRDFIIVISMKSTRRKRAFLTRWGILLLLPSFWFAQEQPSCHTCGAMHSNLQNIIQFSLQTLDILWSPDKILNRWGSYHIFWPWQAGVYSGNVPNKLSSNFIDSIIGGTLRNLDRRQSSLRASTELLSIYAWITLNDGILWLLIIYQPRPLVRDYEYLLDLDSKIWEKISQLGAMGMQWKILNEKERTELIKLLKQHTWPGKLFTQDATLDSALSVSDVLRFLFSLNHLNKHTLTVWWTPKIDTITVWNSSFFPASDYYANISKAYKCARLLSKDSEGKRKSSICSTNFTNFKQSINNITKSFVESGPQQSLETITKASQKLMMRGKIIMGADQLKEQQRQEYLQREQELISSQSHGELIKRTGRNNIIKGAISSNIIRTIKNPKHWETLTTIVQQWKQARTTIQESLSSSPSNTNTLSNAQKKLLSQQATPSQQRIGNTLHSIAQQHFHEKTQQLTISSDDSQEIIEHITRNIRQINDIIANHIKNDLSRTCSLQCSNLWGICR